MINEELIQLSTSVPYLYPPYHLENVVGFGRRTQGLAWATMIRSLFSLSSLVVLFQRSVHPPSLPSITSNKGLIAYSGFNHAHQQWLGPVEPPAVCIDCANPSHSVPAHCSHASSQLYPVNSTIEMSLAHREHKGVVRDDSPLQTPRGGPEGPFSDQALHCRSMPTYKGKHKDIVEQRTSGRSINGTGSHVGGNGFLRIMPADIDPFLKLEGFARTIETLYLQDALWQPLRRQDTSLGPFFSAVDHDNVPGNATTWISAWLTIRPRTDAVTGISINHFHPPPEFFSTTQDREWDKFAAGGPSLVFEILLGLRHCHFRATREEIVMTANCIVDILQDKEKFRRMIARLYSRLEAQKNPLVTTQIVRPSASDIQIYMDPSLTTLDANHFQAISKEDPKLPGSSLSIHTTENSELAQELLPSLQGYTPDVSRKRSIAPPPPQDPKRMKVEDENSQGE
ncbi:uncharacterized protein F5891DRAFT_977335 [Suillus fuscotomentosus]|uniref:Uncharacterized protein n=1 Tax=Suillus fuscotomentosus TaxID=1912939 RepID=A0AAD4ED18_9AGAM|nr:uncharacterized protein F5891DRAFT_977335 [Suillus fuscotomentosus]KAG1903767.1 hypothetical protein F5891DRAFT_977335 [Suillus fuscotomentosus]